MSLMKKIAFAACTAALLLSISTSSALAQRDLDFSVSEFALLDERFTIEDGMIRVTCEVHASFTLNNRLVPKRAEFFGNSEWTVLGQEEGERTERCSEQRARFIEINSFIFYLSFAGTLPRITGFSIAFRELRIQANIGGGMSKCQIHAHVLGSQAINAGVLGTFTINALEEVEVTTVVGMCPRAAFIRIRGSLNLAAPRTVTVRLA